MISAKGLVYNNKATNALLRTLPEDMPLVVQLFGSEPDFLARAAALLLERGFVYFDLNMGCPVPKVVKTGAGAALLKDPRAALAAASALIRVAGPGRVGCKLRLGWTPGEESWKELAPALEQAGAAWLTLHPRFGKEGFSGTARWECLAELKRMVLLPVIASGDLFTAADGVNCLRQSNADAVMFARGAMGNPFVFLEFKALWTSPGKALPAGVSPRALVALIRRHLELALRFDGEHATLLKMRTFVPRYVRHIPGARAFRSRLMQCVSIHEAEELLAAFLQNTVGDKAE
jgi:tRNA-dihydrouridine synthase B